jgi:hypothetical protein
VETWRSGLATARLGQHVVRGAHWHGGASNRGDGRRPQWSWSFLAASPSAESARRQQLHCRCASSSKGDGGGGATRDRTAACWMGCGGCAPLPNAPQAHLDRCCEGGLAMVLLIWLRTRSHGPTAMANKRDKSSQESGEVEDLMLLDNPTRPMTRSWSMCSSARYET